MIDNDSNNLVLIILII